MLLTQYYLSFYVGRRCINVSALALMIRYGRILKSDKLALVTVLKIRERDDAYDCIIHVSQHASFPVVI